MTPFRLRLPATSANLGPGFDALGLAMSLFLDIEASPSLFFHIEATGRNPELVASLHRNLLLDTYCDLLPNPAPLRLKLHNQIPLGMGCGSSAAALLAGVLLANHFAELNLTPRQILEESCKREGHPDNVAACFYGGLTASCMDDSGVTAATLPPPEGWQLVLAIPNASLATSEARTLLPAHYTRSDAVQNIQATALLLSAFALNRPELLLQGSRDRIHQPFRAAVCPLLPLLLPLAGRRGIYSVTLSGAGPSVLLITDPKIPAADLSAQIHAAAGEFAVETLQTSILHPRGAPARTIGLDQQVT